MTSEQKTAAEALRSVRALRRLAREVGSPSAADRLGVIEREVELLAADVRQRVAASIRAESDGDQRKMVCWRNLRIRLKTGNPRPLRHRFTRTVEGRDR